MFSQSKAPCTQWGLLPDKCVQNYMITPECLMPRTGEWREVSLVYPGAPLNETEGQKAREMLEVIEV